MVDLNLTTSIHCSTMHTSNRMSINDLPEEILDSIFDLAADESIILDKELPTAFSTSSWFWLDREEIWGLRTRQESLDLCQSRSYATKKVCLVPFLHFNNVHDTSSVKAIILTSKSWQRIGSKYLFRCLFFDERERMLALCTLFDSQPVFGRWTRRIHVASSSFGALLCNLIRHCPNLEILSISEPMSHWGTFGDSLSTHCPISLQTVHWTVSFQPLSQVIWAICTLPSLKSIHLELHYPAWEDLGAAVSDSGNFLDHPNLRQLSLQGNVAEFMKRACRWNMPSLKSVSLNCDCARPDIVQFLICHGSKLTFLDIYSTPRAAYDVAKVLDLCPLLHTFAFNADWVLPTSHGSPLIRQPHQHITHIGLHGLQSAFNVRYIPASDLDAHVNYTKNNDRNFDSLTRCWVNFPKLNCVRVLNPILLWDLKSGRPSQECLQRWDRWWQMCDEAGIRLEDCTGGIFCRDFMVITRT
jgi:hypothetical protein